MHLPTYLKGERSPIWDSKARGVFFGLALSDDSGSMAYSVREGVAFSLYHIFRQLGSDANTRVAAIRTGGAVAQDSSLNQLKADVFGISFEVVNQKESTALGAAMIECIGKGWYGDIHEAAGTLVKVEQQIKPNPAKKDYLKKRFEIYEKLYPALKEVFGGFGSITETQDE